MYGRAEHSETLRRVMLVANTLKDARTLMQGIRDDLRQDDIAATEKARDRIRQAASALQEAEGWLDIAVTELPTPVKRAEPDWQALLRGGGNDAA